MVSSSMALSDRPALVKRPVAHPAEPETTPLKPVGAAPIATGNGSHQLVGSGVVFAVRIPAELRTRYRVASARSGRPMQDMVIEALERYITELET
jgi:hypothetical protein